MSGRVAAASLPGFQELVGASARPVEDIVEMSIIADDGEGTACDVALPVFSELSQGWLVRHGRLNVCFIATQGFLHDRASGRVPSARDQPVDKPPVLLRQVETALRSASAIGLTSLGRKLLRHLSRSHWRRILPGGKLWQSRHAIGNHAYSFSRVQDKQGFNADEEGCTRNTQMVSVSSTGRRPRVRSPGAACRILAAEGAADRSL